MITWADGPVAGEDRQKLEERGEAISPTLMIPPGWQKKAEQEPACNGSI